MTDNQWTMNCILFGAKIMDLVRKGEDKKVLGEIKSLSSTIDDSTANYILVRLKELA